jgi:hypothetical protein
MKVKAMVGMRTKTPKHGFVVLEFWSVVIEHRLSRAKDDGVKMSHQVSVTMSDIICKLGTGRMTAKHMEIGTSSFYGLRAGLYPFLVPIAKRKQSLSGLEVRRM